MTENTRSAILKEAEHIVNGNREAEYGNAEDNFNTIAMLWSVYIDAKITPKDVAAMMILLKVARTKSGHGKDDTWIDIAGYAACGAEVMEVQE